MPAESTEISIRVEPPDLFITFDRKCDHFVTPWQDAFRLADMLDLAIADVRDDSPPDSLKLSREADQVRLAAVTEGHGTGTVAILFQWTDRLRFTWRSASAFRDALKVRAQDAMLACKGVHIIYGADGMIRELHDLKAGTVQTVR